MVRQGHLVTLAASAATLLALAGLLAAQTGGGTPNDKPPAETKAKAEAPAGKAAARPPAGTAGDGKAPSRAPADKDAPRKAEAGKAPAKPSEAPRADAKRAPDEPIDRQPYRIAVHVGIDPETRIDARKREDLLADWQTLIERFVGAPWDLSVAEGGDDPLTAVPLDALTPESFEGGAEGLDKVWVIRVGRDGGACDLSGREFDVQTGRLGPIHRLPAPFLPDAPRALLQLALELFSPSAVIGERFGKDVSLTVRGASIPAASPIGRVVSAGSIFQPIRLVPAKGGKTRVMDIHFSYLRVEALEGPVARCSMTSIFSDPLTKRMVQANTLIALGVKPGRMPMKLRFVTKRDKAPAAGYLLTARVLPDGLPREIGTTDREGRIVVPAGFANGLVVFRLLAGNIEPMVEFPAMPGDSPIERVIPFEPKPQTVTLETELDALRDQIIDLVAVRARIEARLKARYDGEDWKGLEETLQEFYKLPSRDTFAEQLAKLKEEAAQQQARTKVAILTKTAQAQLADVQALVDRYLDDDLFRGYAEGIKQYKAQAAAEAKSEAKKKSARAKTEAAAATTKPSATPAQAKPATASAPAANGFPAPPSDTTPPPDAKPKPAAPKPAPPASKPASGVPF